MFLQGCALTSITFNDDGHLLATRAMDDTVKLWDIRKLGGGVVKTFPDVPTHLVGKLSVVGSAEDVLVVLLSIFRARTAYSAIVAIDGGKQSTSFLIVRIRCVRGVVFTVVHVRQWRVVASEY